MNLKTLRKEKNKTQLDLAKYLDIKQNSYQRYESGETEPNIKNLIKLADFYNVSVDYLIGRNWNNEIGYLTPQIKELIKLEQQLNQENLIKVIGYVTALVTMQ